jgi:hypothetical protein
VLRYAYQLEAVLAFVLPATLLFVDFAADESMVTMTLSILMLQAISKLMKFYITSDRIRPRCDKSWAFEIFIQIYYKSLCKFIATREYHL